MDLPQSAPGVTLDPTCYWSPDVYEAELDRVFRSGWVAVGHVSQVADAGSYRCVDVSGESLVVTRDRGGLLHVLSRVCPHRWMEACSGDGTARSLQCPYHHWTFNLAGQLRAAPAMGAAFDKSACSLTEFRHEVWEGFIFVNVDGGAPDVRELWSPLADQLHDYRLAGWRVVSTIDWGERPWNWKVLMDNGECYHHLGLHQHSLEPLYPARDVRDAPDNGAFTCLVAPAREARDRAG
ncbi:MAG: aromatic ring-hydroxylating oxygenase subunit alpha [Acidimicrobiales bacterium]